MKTTVETTTKSTVVPVLNRSYSLISTPTTTPKGKQRQIVLTILSSNPSPMTIKEVSDIWTSTYLHINSPVDGVLNSVRYHLHHLTLDGVTKY